mgnify:CR=1 FL=1
MKIININDAPAQAVTMEGAAHVTKRLPIGKADGSPSFSARVFTLAPGGYTPYHEHAWEHLNYIIAGKGELLDADGQARPLQPGDFALVQPGEKHQYRNASATASFIMICAVPSEYE